jgi:chemotaxis signal transduction protein
MLDNFVNFSQQDTEIVVKTISLKILVFPVGNLYLALPVDYVSKVIDRDKVYSSGLNHVGTIHTGDRTITIVDIHQKIYLTPETSEKKGYFILTQNNRGEQFGVYTTKSPSMFDIPLSEIRQLPSSFRQADTLGIASHVTIIDKQELVAKDAIQKNSERKKRKTDDNNSESATIFLLDVDRLLG